MGVVVALLLFVASAGAGEINDPYVRDCGIYRASGRLDCTEMRCRFTVFSGSQAEKIFEVMRLSENYIPFNHQSLAIRFSLNKGAAPFTVEIIDPFPKIAALSGADDEFVLEKKVKCQK